MIVFNFELKVLSKRDNIEFDNSGVYEQPLQGPQSGDKKELHNYVYFFKTRSTSPYRCKILYFVN